MSITSANAVLTISVATIIPTAQRIQGFSTDDIYNIPAIRRAETAMGVDGVLSGGFIYEKVVQTIMLQADSASNSLFDLWDQQQQAAQEVYEASGLIVLSGVATKFTQVRGFLTSYSPAPAAKKTLQPRSYEITWERVTPAPI